LDTHFKIHLLIWHSYGGKFSTAWGPNWVNQFVTRTGIEVKNLAFPGATTARSIIPPAIKTPFHNFTDVTLIHTFEEQVAEFVTTYGGKKAVPWSSDNTLFVLPGTTTGNDIGVAYNWTYAPGDTHTKAWPQLVQPLVNHIDDAFELVSFIMGVELKYSDRNHYDSCGVTVLAILLFSTSFQLKSYLQYKSTILSPQSTMSRPSVRAIRKVFP
jgi:hypothetical protein